MRWQALLFSFVIFACADGGTDGSPPPGSVSTPPSSELVSYCGAAGTTPVAGSCATPFVPGVALAICNDIAADNTLSVQGGDIVANGSVRIASPLHAYGSLLAMKGIQADNTHEVEGDLRTAGDWSISSPAHVRGSAFVGGELTARNSVKVDGMLHVQSLVDDTHVMAGGVGGAMPVTSPLDCSSAIDVRPLDPSPGAPLEVKMPAELSIGCGEYQVASLASYNPLTVRVTGDATMVINGDMRIASPTRFEVAPGAHFRLIVRNNLEIDNTLTITGGATWLAVGNRMHVGSPTNLDGDLYAPYASLEADNTLDVQGSIWAASLHVASPIKITPSASAEPACAPR